MTSQPAHACFETSAPPLPEADMLQQLAATGLRIAEAIGREVEGLADSDELSAIGRATALERLALSYDRAARAVRLSIMLRDKLATEQPAALPGRREGLQRILVRVGEHEGRYRDRTVREIADRLDHDFCGDLLTRPVSEVVAQICKDVGLKPDWPRLAGEAWVLEELSSGQVGWPLAGFRLATAEDLADEMPEELPEDLRDALREPAGSSP